jgi:hypothetical protein
MLIPAAGCSNNDDDEYLYDSGTDNGNGLPGHNNENGTGNIALDRIDFDAAMVTFPPDTPMIISGELIISWGEFYAFMFRTVTNLIASYGAAIDWSEELDDGYSIADLILEFATEEALSFMTYEYGIKSLGLTLSDDDIAMLNEDIEYLISLYGSMEALEDSLRENSGISSFEIFEKLIKVEFFIELIVEELYGENALSFPDESVAQYASQNGYMMALHILRMKTEDGDDTPLNESENILARLNEQVGSDDFVDFFKELMREESEDLGGMMSFPGGYLFQHSDMVEPFSDACAELEIGQLSGIVETTFGYHIILRIPIDYDAIPIASSNERVPHTLRQLAVLYDFELIMHEWRNSLDVNLVFSPEYLSIDLETMFRVR